MYTFPDLIRARRISLALTQADLAEALGVSVSAVAKWEAGERLPTRRVARLANVLGWTPDEARTVALEVVGVA